MSSNRSRTRRFQRRSKAFAAALEERQTDEFVAELRALADGPTVFDEPDVDADAPTEQIPAIAPLADWERDLLADPPEQRDVQPWECHDPDDAPAWSEQEAHALGAELAAAADYAATVIAEQILEGVVQPPVPRRRHLPAVGAWFADRLRPVPLPAIPDAAELQPVPLSAARLKLEAGPAEESGRLALAAAATTEHFDQARPDDFVEWLRWEFAEIDAKCAAAVAEHARDAQAGLDTLPSYFLGAQHTFDELNAMTLPGWTRLENDLKTDLYSTGAFA